MTCNAVLTDSFNNLNNWTGAGQALVTGRNGQGFQNLNAYSKYSLAAPVQFDTITIGFSVIFPSLIADNDVIQLCGDAGATKHVWLRLGSDRNIYAYMGSATLLGNTTGGTAMPAAGTWSFVEMQARVHDTLGFVKVSVNGVQKLNITSVDTK